MPFLLSEIKKPSFAQFRVNLGFSFIFYSPFPLIFVPFAAYCLGAVSAKQ